MRNLKVGTGTIAALVYRLDGSALVALDLDNPTNRVRVFPLPDGRGKTSVAITGSSVVLSPDGSRAASVSFNRLRVWALSGDSKTSYQPFGPLGLLHGVGFSDDGQLVLASGRPQTGAAGRQLFAWDPDAAKIVWQLDCAAGQEIAAAASRVVTAGTANFEYFRVSAGALLVEGGRVARHLPVPRGEAQRVRFSPDGAQVGIARGRTVFVLDAATGAELYRLTGHKGLVRDLAFSPDGRLIATGGNDERVKFWDARTGRPRATFAWRIDMIGALAFAPDGLTCAAGGTSGRVVMWDVDE